MIATLASIDVDRDSNDSGSETGDQEEQGGDEGAAMHPYTDPPSRRVDDVKEPLFFGLKNQKNTLLSEPGAPPV